MKLCRAMFCDMLRCAASKVAGPQFQVSPMKVIIDVKFASKATFTLKINIPSQTWKGAVRCGILLPMILPTNLNRTQISTHYEYAVSCFASCNHPEIGNTVLKNVHTKTELSSLYNYLLYTILILSKLDIFYRIICHYSTYIVLDVVF